MKTLKTKQPSHLTAIELIRAEFESCVKNSRFKDNTPLGTMTINGAFNHYMDAETDTMWMGFSLGFLTAQKLNTERGSLLTILRAAQ